MSRARESDRDVACELVKKRLPTDDHRRVFDEAASRKKHRPEPESPVPNEYIFERHKNPPLGKLTCWPEYQLYSAVYGPLISRSDTKYYHFEKERYSNERGFTCFYTLMKVWSQKFGRNQFVFLFGRNTRTPQKNASSTPAIRSSISCPRDFTIWLPGEGRRAHVEYHTTIRCTSDESTSNEYGVFVPFEELYNLDNESWPDGTDYMKEVYEDYSKSHALIWMPKDGFRVCVPENEHSPVRIHSNADDALLATVWREGSAIFAGPCIDETLRRLLLVWGIFSTRMPEGLCRLCTHCPVCQRSSASLPEYHAFAEHLIKTVDAELFGFEDYFPRRIGDSEFWRPVVCKGRDNWDVYFRRRVLWNDSNSSMSMLHVRRELEGGCIPKLVYSKSGLIQSIMEDETCSVQNCHAIVVSALREQNVADPNRIMKAIDIIAECRPEYIFREVGGRALAEFVVDLIVTANYLNIEVPVFHDDDFVPSGITMTRLEYSLTQILGDMLSEANFWL